MLSVEYRIAMLTRHYRPWLTSGACIMARTASLRLICAHHSQWTPGEDIETGRAAVALRLRIRHADMTVWTHVPETCRALVHQRRHWWAGNFRHAIVNLDRNAVHLPVMTLYWLLLIWSSVWFKAWMLLFPPYALVQSLVMPPLGIYTYARIAYRRRRLGRYRFGYRRGVPATA